MILPLDLRKQSMIRVQALPGDVVIDLSLYAIFFLLIVVMGWRLRQRRGRLGAAAVGSVYEMLNEEKRNAIEMIVEDKAAEQDPEHADDTLPPDRCESTPGEG